MKDKFKKNCLKGMVGGPVEILPHNLCEKNSDNPRKTGDGTSNASVSK